MSGLVIHVPHASTTVPSGFVDQFRLSEKEIQAEAHISADLYTDLLAELGSAEWECLVSVLREMPIYDETFLAADARRTA